MADYQAIKSLINSFDWNLNSGYKNILIDIGNQGHLEQFIHFLNFLGSRHSLYRKFYL